MKKTLLLASLSILLSACTAPATQESTTAAEPANRVTRGNLVSQGLPSVPDALVQDMQRYRNTRSASFAGFVGSDMLISTRFAQTRQLHRVSRAGGARQQFTFFDEPVREVAIPISNDGFVFTKDVGGAEFFQLFWFDWATGSARLLSDGKARHSGVLFANESDKFAYTSNERDGVHFDVYVRTPDQPSRRVVTSDGGSWQALDWSADNQHLLVLKYVSRNISYLYEVDLNSGDKRLLAGGDSQTFVGGAVYGPTDGENSGKIYYLSDQGRQFITLRQLDAASGQDQAITADIPWSVEDLVMAPSGERLAFSVNDEGVSSLYLLNTRNNKYSAVDGLPTSIVSGMQFSPDSSRLALTLGRPTRPTDVYLLDFASRELNQWTFSETGGLDSASFVEPTLIRYPSFVEEDGRQREIPAFVYTPKTPGPHPVLVLFHGGPEAQYRPYFSATVQYYVNELGIAVIAPNVRGSAGYGKEYLLLDNGLRRDDSVKDAGALFDWIAKQPNLKADKVAVYGGSYGGYMVLGSMVTYPDKIAAGIDVVGISDFVTFLENTQAYRQDLRRAEYGDERDPEVRAYLKSIAPLGQVERIKAPLLVAQGFNDPRVPYTESEQIVSALEAQDIPVWYLLFKNEGHGFRKKANSDLASAAYVMFLQQHLL